MTDEPTKAELIDRIESLEEQQAEFAAEQEQVLGLFEQFKQGQISRRSFLTAVAAVGGVGLLAAGRSRAAPSWGSSTGKVGTSSTPLSEGYIQTLKSQSFTTESVDFTGVTPDYRLGAFGSKNETSNQTTTSTSYTGIFTLTGGVDISAIPDGMSLYGRFVIRMKNDTSNETTSARPNFFDPETGNSDAITELAVSVTDTSFQFADSGWTQISTNLSGFILPNTIRGKVTGGTGTFVYQDATVLLAGVA